MALREPYWVKLFLRELSRTGNVRISAERAGVDFSTAYQRRKRHGEFAERWEGALRLRSGQALGAFRDGLGQAGALDVFNGERGAPSPGSPPASPSSPPRGEDVVVRPDGKVIKGSEARWGKRAEERFLTELTVSGSVRLAAKAAGFSTTAVYQRRLKDRHFAAAWEAAVETGKARVQAYLVEAATRTFDPDQLPVGDEREVPKVSIGEAINIAKMKGSADARKASDEDGQFYTDQEIEEARERIFNRLTRIRDRIAEHQQETGCCHACGQVLPDVPLEETRCALPKGAALLYSDR